MDTLNAFEAAARIFEPNQPRDIPWDTPMDLAVALDPRTVRTPALDLISDALTDVAEGRCNRLMISMSPQEGKALALDTPIVTPTGWSTMGELKVGDEVFDRHGEPCKVTWVSPTWENRPCYTVRTGDGEAIVADAAHEWPARLRRDRGERLHETTVLAKKRQKNAQITGPADLNLPEADLPLDPYVLGAWLGDGSSKAAMLTSADIEIVERIRDAGIPCRKGRGKYDWSLTPEGERGCSPIRQALISLGVWGNKHIPTAYLRGSTKQRLALLQGLIDTDGYVSPKGQVEFTSMKEQLARDVQHLVFTLGAKATIASGRATIDGRDCGTKWRVKFYLVDAAHLPRKAIRCKDSSVARIRYTWAEPTESVPVRCIEVDSPDHTYLAGRSLLPTHNSEAASRRFPTWMLARFPWLRIAVVSYAHNIARRWGKRIRDDIAEHGDVLGIMVDPNSSAAHEWKLAGYDGSVYCVGIKGALTGKPVDLLIVDDPYRDGEQADSETWQETVEDWWQEVAVPRLGPGVACVIIQTRWRHNDLTGWLQTREDGTDWRVINIPAQADHNPAEGGTDVLGRSVGEYMISARGRTLDQWEQRKREVGSRAWLALFQGRPTPASGNVFQRSWFTEHAYDQPQWVEQGGAYTALGFDEVILSWDMAFKDTDGADYVCGQVWGRRGVEAWLLDQTHEHLDFVDTCTAVRILAARWPQARAKYVEDKANGTAVINMLKRTVGGLIPVEPEGSKVARAAAVSPLVEAGNVHIPSPELAPWVGDLIEEATGFPRAAHDDRVDAMTQALNRLLINPLLIDDDVIEDDEAEQHISPY